MNAIQLLTKDHEEVASMFDELLTADKGDRSAKQLFNELNSAITLHAQIEEQLFYPALESHKDTSDIVAESLDAHQEVKDLLTEISALAPGDDEFMDKITELRDNIENHVEEEENELFPKAEKILGKSRLDEMGRQMQQMKQGKSATATTKRK